MKKHIEEYLKVSEKLEKLEREVLKEIVMYLIKNSIRPDKRTLREMERELKIPYSRLRRLINKLVSLGVVVEGSVGNAKPYSVIDIDLALRKGLLPIEEKLEQVIDLFFSALPYLDVAILGEVKGDEMYRSLPRAPLRTKECQRIVGLIEYMRYLATLPGELEIIEKFKEKWPKEEIVHREELYKKIKEEISKEEWRKLIELHNEAKKWGIFYSKSGGLPELYMPFMRSNMVRPPMEKIPEHIIGEMMRHTGLPKEAIIPLRHFSCFDPWALYFRDIMFELNFKDLNQVSEEELKRIIIKIAEKNLKFLIYLLEPLIEDLEKYGVRGTLDKWNQEVSENKKYTKIHILAEAIPIGFASLFVLKIGGNKELAKKGLMISKMIEASVIYDYKGKKEEGMNLEEFTKMKFKDKSDS